MVHLQNDGPPGAVDEPGRPGWRLHLAPTVDEPVLRKTADDGFADTGLQQLLRSRGVQRIAISGLLSEMCVAATACAAMERGFRVVLARNVHGTYDLDEIPASVVARVAEHALGDDVELVRAATAIKFSRPEARESRS